MGSPRPRQTAEGSQAGAPEMPGLEESTDSHSDPLDGDVFLILGLPPHSTVGCDARAINTGASAFKGIRDMPPGSHFVWVSGPSAMSRCGYWFVTQPRGQVRVTHWDPYNEVLAQPASPSDLRRHRDSAASLRPQLVPFTLGAGPAHDPGALGQEPLWPQLTACISQELLGRVTGDRGAREWLVDTSDCAQGESSFPLAAARPCDAGPGPRELTFLFPEGDVDLGAPDTTMDILRLLDTPGTRLTGSDVVGELQFAFLTGLHLSNLSCVDQWWHLLLRVVLRAHRLALLRPRLARSLVRTLHAQLVYDESFISRAAPQDPAAPRHEYEYGGAHGAHGTSVLDITPANRRRLRRALVLYRRSLHEILHGLAPARQHAAEHEAVGQAFADLEGWFWERERWDLGADEGAGGDIDHGDDGDDDDDDDYHPVIVDLDEHGREVGLVSFN